MNVQCPNCLDDVPMVREACVFEALLSVVAHRQEIARNDATLMAYVASLKDDDALHPDALWDEIGPVIDRLEAGYLAFRKEG